MASKFDRHVDEEVTEKWNICIRQGLGNGHDASSGSVGCRRRQWSGETSMEAWQLVSLSTSPYIYGDLTVREYRPSSCP